MDDLDFWPQGDPRPGAPAPRKCRRHDWNFYSATYGEPGIYCGRCGQPKDAASSRRGTNNRQRGNAIEREVAKSLGLRRVGQYGGPEDVSGDMFVVQVKSGGAFSERYWAWLQALPRNAGQTPLLVVTDAPGPGHRRRAVVVVELSDWVALHGPVAEDAA